MAGFSEHGNEPSDSVKCWKILEHMSDWQLPMEASVLWS
jgi:hypothetical protein